MFDADAMTKLMSRLSASRLVFHSEADFQHALAWESHQTWPQQLVRLETRPAKGIHLDLVLIDRLAGREVALELKYLTASWQGVARQESFDLLSQGAQDIRAYDCIKDISRVERFVYDRPSADGAVVVLTNDSNYWTPRSHARSVQLLGITKLDLGDVAGARTALGAALPALVDIGDRFSILVGLTGLSGLAARSG